MYQAIKHILKKAIVRGGSALSIPVIEIVHNWRHKGHRKLAPRYEEKAHQVEPALMQDLRAFVVAYETRAGRRPSILDWHTGLAVKSVFPDLAIFSPPGPSRHPSLPYIDQSIDVVLCPSQEASFIDEARRIAIDAVLTLEENAANVQPRLMAAWQAGTETAVPLPGTSIIIPVYNQVQHTQNCLHQLRRTLPAAFNGEVLVVDDGSTDETPEMVAALSQQWPAVKLLRNPENLGFIGSCNRAAETAQGTFLIFLNNDTLPQPGWFLPLLNTFEHYPDAGAVGGKLMYPDGTLQEAGGIIFSDGSGWNFGRYDAAVNHPLYNHVREVDYCSGALLATRREVFLRLGGFDTLYEPAYYEDADYGFQLRQHHLKVYYQPESVVIHFEGLSSGTDITAGVKRHQAINKQRFVNKWQKALQRQPPPPPAVNQQFQYQLVVREEFEVEDTYAY